MMSRKDMPNPRYVGDSPSSESDDSRRLPYSEPVIAPKPEDTGE